MRWGFIRNTLLASMVGCFLWMSACSSESDSSSGVDASSVDTGLTDAGANLDSVAPDGTVVPDVPALELCTSDEDCDDAGATCTCNGVCATFETNPCLVDKNCPSDQFCDACAGFCAPEVGVCESCTTDAACGDGGACLPFVSGGSF